MAAKQQPTTKPNREQLVNSIQSLSESLLKFKYKPVSFVQSIKDMIGVKKDLLKKHYNEVID
mgnify:FL=1